MKLGSFEVPEKRLIPYASSDIKIIYDNIQNEPTKSMDIASLLGYKHATASPYYLRLKALTAYGLLEGRSKYKVSELGKKFAYSESDEQLHEVKTNAVLNVALWKAIYDKYKKLPPKENFWVQLKNITGIEPKKARAVEPQILKWYMDDIAHVSDDLVLIKEESDQPSEGIRSSSPKEKPEVDEDMETISFDKYTIKLPKGDLSKDWEKLKQYMDIKLKDYKYEEPVEEEKFTPITEEPQEE